MHANGWQLGVQVAHQGAKGGHLDVLSFLHRLGVSFDAETLRSAGGVTSVENWLLDHGCTHEAVVPSYEQHDASKGYADGHTHSVEVARDVNVPIALPAGDGEEERLLEMALVATG